MKTKIIMVTLIVAFLMGQAIVSAQYMRVDQTIEEKSLSGDVLKFNNHYLIKQDGDRTIYRVDTDILTPVQGWPSQVVTFFDFQNKRICLQSNNPPMMVYHDIRDVVRFKIPAIGMETAYTNVVLTNAVDEQYGQWNCSKQTYLIALGNGLRYTSTVWYAQKLRNMPIHIENEFSYGQEIITFNRWQFDLQDIDDHLLSMPKETLSQLIGQ